MGAGVTEEQFTGMTALVEGDLASSVSRSPADSGRPGTSSSVSTSDG